MICERCGCERTEERCTNCEALGLVQQLADASMEKAADEGKHATCRFYPGSMVYTESSAQPTCGWSGPVFDLVDGLCPNGHGGTWLAIHNPGDPVEPLPPRWDWECTVCEYAGDSTDPHPRCMNCGSETRRPEKS